MNGHGLATARIEICLALHIDLISQYVSNVHKLGHFYAFFLLETQLNLFHFYNLFCNNFPVQCLHLYQ